MHENRPGICCSLGGDETGCEFFGLPYLQFVSIAGNFEQYLN
jgi:hypothetical protein